MAEAFGWGLLAASSLVIGAVIALRFRISLRGENVRKFTRSDPDPALQPFVFRMKSK